jgi:hypothetical protein
MSDSTSTSTATTVAGSIDPAPSSRLRVLPWLDPVVDDAGYDPRSRYVELFWLGVLGPTATWLIRRLAAGLDRSPEGFDLDLEQTAREMGLSYHAGRSSPFSKAMQRCVMFGLAHPVAHTAVTPGAAPGPGLAVRRRVPPVTSRHVQRMPVTLQAAHHDWQCAVVPLDELTRAHTLATTMLDLGDDATVIEHRLVAVGVSAAVAAEVADNALRLVRSAPTGAG